MERLTDGGKWMPLVMKAKHTSSCSSRTPADTMGGQVVLSANQDSSCTKGIDEMKQT